MSKSKLRDAIYGLAVGDALGVPFEFEQRGTFTCTEMTGYGTYNLPAGTWSDDTSMTLATCDSLRENEGRIDVEDMRSRFVSWFKEDAYTVDGMFDIGNATRKALSIGRGLDGEMDNGNGSLMRIIPLAFTNATDEQIAAVSSITHAHELSTSTCRNYVNIARMLISGFKLEEIPAVVMKRGLEEADIQSTGYVAHTFDAALWCLATTYSYEECVLKAVNLGEDTDTTAAVAGALAGIYYGYEAIPAQWIETLRGKEIIDSVLF